jgi:two-component system NtrC family sensor kinase
MVGSGPGTRVLVVDADARSLEMLAVALLDSGFAVRTAASAAEALDEARRRPPALVLSDVAIPGMDGFQLCAALRGDPELGSVPVVLLSGGQPGSPADRGLRERGATAGASDYLTKPIDLPRLVQVVQRLSA